VVIWTATLLGNSRQKKVNQMATKYQDLRECIEEAERFLRIASDLKERSFPAEVNWQGEWVTPTGPKRAATLRASLDLSKALSRLRNNKE
jgi:hypothetical protein